MRRVSDWDVIRVAQKVCGSRLHDDRTEYLAPVAKSLDIIAPRAEGEPYSPFHHARPGTPARLLEMREQIADAFSGEASREGVLGFADSVITAYFHEIPTIDRREMRALDSLQELLDMVPASERGDKRVARAKRVLEEVSLGIFWHKHLAAQSAVEEEMTEAGTTLEAEVDRHRLVIP